MRKQRPRTKPIVFNMEFYKLIEKCPVGHSIEIKRAWRGLPTVNWAVMTVKRMGRWPKVDMDWNDEAVRIHILASDPGRTAK